ncbi:methyl-accepting chemotaxis protein [Pseudomonas oryzihabitans]|uniref:methyl-accepting chemotaxis protein n=1 Tax=Pseudomonas oryzihabitans TaxID=47885 RepID=UPI0028938C59|nr:methyl-accepting chemotaxis protein [Pseudomonas oryzihabitans]MDT3719388.1 methyl-accepting chemotaxis protein [Pseudomonas oryzihabitans]
MGVLLSPGIRVLSRFGFARKFALLFVLFLLPMGISLWLLGADFQAKLSTVSGERSGVRLLQRLDALEAGIIAQRNLTARWKAIDVVRQPTPAVQAAIAAMEQRIANRQERLAALQQQVQAERLGAGVNERLQTLQQALKGLGVEDLRNLGWWPDGYDRLTNALVAVQALREEIALSSGLILDPWLETYLLMQIGTTQAVDLTERLGRLGSIGQTSVVAGQFSLQSRLQLRDLRARVGDSRDSLVKVGTLLSDKLPASMASWSGDYQQLLGQLDASLKRIDDGLYGTEITFKPEQFEATIDGILQGLQTFRQQTLLSLDGRLQYYATDAVRSFSVIAAGFGLLLIVTCYLLLCMQAAIRGSARGITTLAEGLRDGDLTRTARIVGQDELADIGQALDLAVVQLRGSLQAVDQESRQVGVASGQLGQQAESALGAVEAQRLQITQIATAATELAATAQGVAESCEQAAGRAEQMREMAQASQNDSRQTTSSIQRLNQRLGDTAEAMAQVNAQAGQIQQVVDVIRGIAEQTNLLALNAAIEAARAGDQGRGFAVVADEVRSLSQRTQASTAQIAGTVGSLSSTVAQAVSLMQEACGQAASDAQSVTGLGRRLEEIAESVQGVSDTLVQIATAAEEQAATADEVSGNIQQIDAAAADLLGNARTVQNTAAGLAEGSRTLVANTTKFRLS